MIRLLANPASRSGKGKRLWKGWTDRLRSQRLPHDLRVTASREDCRKQAELACRDSSIVVAVGGDGTINAVLTGLLHANPPHASPQTMPDQERTPASPPSGLPANGVSSPPVAMLDASDISAPPVALPGDGSALPSTEPSPNNDPLSPPLFGVLYAGTSPDFCRFHGIPTEPQAAMDTLLAGRARPVDVAAITFSSPAGKKAEGYFACGCHIGLGAATAAFANTWRKHLGDRCGTGIGLARAMFRHTPFACRILADADVLHFARANHVMILKNPHIASGLRVTLPLEPDDGGLALVVVHGHSSLGLLRLLPLLYSGALAKTRGVHVRRCASVHVETVPPQPVEFDGDPQGHSPVAIRLSPKALPLLCPSPQGAAHARN